MTERKQLVAKVAGAVRSPRNAVMLDQGFSTLSNFLLSFTVARSSSATDFGAFGLTYAVYWIFLGLGRACVSEVLAARWSDDLENGRAMLRGGLSIAGILAIVGGVAATASTIGLGGDTWIFGLFVTLALVQDALRSCWIAIGRPQRALLSDILWVICQSSIAAWVFLGIGFAGAAPYFVAWGFGAIVSLAPFWRVLLGELGSRDLPSYFLTNRSIGWRYCAEFLASFGSYQLLFFVIAGVAGLDAVGALRGAYTIVGPLGVLVSGLLAAAVPEMSRHVRRRGPRGLALTAGAYSIGLVGAMLLLAIAWTFLPSGIGPAILGDTWQGTSPVLFAIFCAIVVNGLSVGPRAGLRALSWLGGGIAVRLLAAPASAVFAGLGLVFNGVEGAAWGVVAGNAVGALVAFVQFVQQARRSRQSVGDGQK